MTHRGVCRFGQVVKGMSKYNQTKLKVLWWTKTQLKVKRQICGWVCIVEVKQEQPNENGIVPIGRNPKETKSKVTITKITEKLGTHTND